MPFFPPPRGRLAAVVLAYLLVPSSEARAQRIPTPEEHFGFSIGADRKLADWDDLTSYFDRLARASARIAIDTLGASTMGRPLVMLTVTSPENHARLDRLREVQGRLADPRTVSSENELDALLEEGRTIVLITHGIHATEVGGTQMAAQLLWRLASSEDPRIQEILENVVLLDIPSLNPDGTQWIARWYAENVGTPFEAAPLPWLYHFYVGHDNNRDWYAFTQVETRHVVNGAHNAWHPQIVHDIHQMGANGARMFLPPYVDPVERNVDPALVSALGQLGTWMAARLTAEGKDGVVINAIYDAFTPARAYQHYHGGVRILGETASADLATPVTIFPGAINGGRGYDRTTPSWNYPRPWTGGEWRLADIVEYMESGALALLTNAARNRRFWLENFYRVGERAVSGWDHWPDAWVIPATERNLANRPGLDYVLRILAMGGVEVQRAEENFGVGSNRYPSGSWVVPMHQPYASFAQALLETQAYPDLREYPGGPPRQPYDVTAHTLPLLMGVDAIPVDGLGPVPLSAPIAPPEFAFQLPEALTGPDAPRIALYKSWMESMESGWTRWLFDAHSLAYDTLHDADFQRGDLAARYDVVLLQSQSAQSIRDGFATGDVPARYAGGLGDEGVRELRDFVRGGGRLVAVEEATDFVVSVFDLHVGNAVERLPRSEFFVPGSIVRLELEEDAMAGALEPGISGWYGESSRAFDVSDPTIRVMARYAEGNPVVSGWILGPGYLAGRPAMVRARVGRGEVVLFGFQPNYRGQSVATWPLLFNALSVPRAANEEVGDPAETDRNRGG